MQSTSPSVGYSPSTYWPPNSHRLIARPNPPTARLRQLLALTVASSPSSIPSKMTIIIPPVPPPEVMTLPVTPDPNTYTFSRNHNLPPTPPYTPGQPKRESGSGSRSDSGSGSESAGPSHSNTFDAVRRLSLESAVSKGATSGSADTSATSIGSYPHLGDLSSVTHRRLLSDNELSYYLPSRADGVNDM